MRILWVGLILLCEPLIASNLSSKDHTSHAQPSSPRAHNTDRRGQQRETVAGLPVSEKDSKAVMNGLNELLNKVYQINTGRSPVSATN